MTFDATDELSNLNKNNKATNNLIKKEQNQFLTLEMGPITQLMEVESSIVSSEQSYRRSRKRIRPGFLP